MLRNAYFVDLKGQVLNNISIKEFYPLMNLEREEECTIYGILPFRGNHQKICRFCFSEKYIGYFDEGGENGEEKIRSYFNPDNLGNSKIKESLENFSCDEVACKSMPVIRELRENI